MVKFHSETKRCFKCGRELSPECFYRHPAMSDGHLNKCKDCTKDDNRKNRASKHDYYIAYDMKRDATPERKVALLSARARYKNRHKDKILARNKAWSRYRKIVGQQICGICGSKENVEMHHPDYSRPRDVQWLCKRCHEALHAKVDRE